MSLRLGILGGMFDPVHDGHVAVARKALDELQLDRVHVIPCHVPAHRQSAVVSGAHRLAMLQLALAGQPGLVADDRELQRPDVSYTVNTLESFRQQFPTATLVCIMGWDSFAGLTRWHRWEALLQLAHLCIAARGIAASGIEAQSKAAQPPAGRALQAPDLEQRLRDLLAQRLVTDTAALFAQRVGNIFLLEELALPHSSTAVRASLQAGGSPDAALAPAVLHYIQQHQLYS